MTVESNVSRCWPDEPFPPYSYVPGHAPHPVSDPAGHMFGHEPADVDGVDEENWHDSRPYLFGVDLFNFGYYWEAHEAWESLWHAAGRRGPTADFLKGLIKLAAAAVKAREGNPMGARRHAARARELFLQAGKDRESLLGLRLDELLDAVDAFAILADKIERAQPELRMPSTLQPRRHGV